MQISNIPAKFPIPFASGAGPSFVRPIPQASQIGINPGYASLTDGFPPLNFTPIAAGGVPPFGQDINGILLEITQWSQWQQAGGPVFYDSAFSTAIGGYPLGAMLMSALVTGNIFMSTVDGNTTDPDSSSSANWTKAPGTLGTGDFEWSPTNIVPFGFVPANASTIGNASSGSGVANPMTWPLFRWHWLNFSNSQCPVFTSAGVPSTRGANPAADYAANKQIQILDMRGTGQGGVDYMNGGVTTRLNNVPAVSGSGTVPGSVLGENLHQLSAQELAAVTPTFSGNSTTPTFSGNSTTPSFSGNAITPVFVGGQGLVSVSSSRGDIYTTNNAVVVGVPVGNPAWGFNAQGQGVTVTSTGFFTPAGSINTIVPTGAISAITPAGSISAITPSGSISPFGNNVAHNTYERNMLGFWLLKL